MLKILFQRLFMNLSVIVCLKVQIFVNIIHVPQIMLVHVIFAWVVKFWGCIFSRVRPFYECAVSDLDQ